jgi:PAS domain S-box-containing protein
MSLSDLTSSPEFARESEADERRLLEHGSPLLDVVRRHRQGKKEGAWVSETKAPILSSLGGTLGIVGVWRDVTDRIEMSEALRNSEERLREQTSVLNSILDSMGDGVVVADREGQALLFTEQAERLLGGPPPEKLTAGWHEAFGICLVEDKRPLADADNPLLRAMLEERTVSLELLARDAHGPERVLAVTATPLRGKAGLAGGVALLRDVTQERALEQQLFHSQKMDAIGRLAGGVAHDFNNLLSVIQSYAQLFLNGMREDDPLREDMGQVMAASQLAASLTRQLLAFCRRQVVQPKVLQVNAVVADIEKMLRRIIGEDIALVTSLSPGLGAVRADPGHIEQIIVNLTVNARDAMPDGGTLRIETGNVRLAPEQAQARAVQAGEYVVLRVSDTGIGMSPETRERIFEPFFTTKDVGKGTGLGLSTVYGIVQQAGGQIVVESELGHGTSLEIQFPRVDIARADGPDTQSIVAASAKTATILLVEDNEAVRTVGARILRGSGYTVFDTGRASEARALCRDRGAEVNLLLIDVVMPEISGPKLATELVVLCPNARVLFMSGYAGTTLPSEDSWHERAGFLEKPFTPASLASRVREVLETATSVGDRAS